MFQDQLNALNQNAFKPNVFKPNAFKLNGLLAFLILMSLSAFLASASSPPSLTDFMQVYGKIQNYEGLGDELLVQAGEEGELVSVWVKSDGTFGYSPTLKIIGQEGDYLYFYFGEDQAKLSTTETYQNKAVKEIILNLPVDCQKPSTWPCIWSACTNEIKTASCSCEDQKETRTESCCQPDWVNCTEWSSCSGGQKTRTCTDANACNPKSLTKTETESCGVSDHASKGSCNPKWNCGSWSLCTANLKKSRTCIDYNDCENDKTEEIACEKCQESWICGLWSNCFNNLQVRTCHEEHNCGTSLQKPKESQACLSPKSAVSSEAEKPVSKPKASCSDGIKNQNELGLDCGGVCKPCPIEETDKTDYTIYYLIAGIVLVLGAIGALLYFFVFGPKSSSLDENTLEELKKVYDSQEEKGLTSEEITEKLVERGWDEQLLKKFLRKR